MSLIPSGFAKSAAAGGFYDHPIEQSLRFNDNDSAYLSWTPASAGNRKTWTWSGWVKKTKTDIPVGGISVFYAGNTTSSPRGGIVFGNSGGDKLSVYGMLYNSATTVLALETTAQYRDPSSWYHVVVALDTTQATASDRCKIYINGEQVTDFTTATYPSQNQELQYNDAVTHATRHPSGNYLYDGYLAEVHFIDGTALDATSFGEFKSGVWIPKAYTGTYGTNGFYLDFDGTYYNDKSGNGNNFTANNLAATDVVLDSPTNNFATLNPVHPNSDSYGSEGNLRSSLPASNLGHFSTMAIPKTGKWYFEVRLNSASNIGDYNQAFGLRTNDNTSYFHAGLCNGNVGRYYRLTSYVNGASQGAIQGSDTCAVGDIYGMAINMDAGEIRLYKNGSATYSGNNMATGLSNVTKDLFPYLWRYTSYSANESINFGQDSSFAGLTTAGGNTDDNGYGDFYYAPPTGYLALCTANLEVPDAMNPALDNSPQDYFNTVLWTGDNVNGRNITGVGFQPDWVWLKNRGYAVSHILHDAVRGIGSNALRTDASSGESGQFVNSFNTDGFNVNNNIACNASSYAYAAWNWKANGSGVSNTDGSITSTVSANTDAGFSIVSWNGSGSTATIGHGLSSAPDVIIAKNRSAGSTYWHSYFDAISGMKDGYITLNTTNAFTSGLDVWGNTAPTSTVFSMGGTYMNTSGDDYIAYCFHSVEGYSKFGSYTGNGSADGTFVYTGFRPAFVIMKRTNSTSYWMMMDSERGSYNVNATALWSDLSNAEYTGSNVYTDFTSNGFKLRNNNTGTGNNNVSGSTYIYMAFASNPMKFSTAV